MATLDVITELMERVLLTTARTSSHWWRKPADDSVISQQSQRQTHTQRIGYRTDERLKCLSDWRFKLVCIFANVIQKPLLTLVVYMLSFMLIWFAAQFTLLPYSSLALHVLLATGIRFYVILFGILIIVWGQFSCFPSASKPSHNPSSCIFWMPNLFLH